MELHTECKFSSLQGLNASDPNGMQGVTRSAALCIRVEALPAMTQVPTEVRKVRAPTPRLSAAMNKTISWSEDYSFPVILHCYL